MPWSASSAGGGRTKASGCQVVPISWGGANTVTQILMTPRFIGSYSANQTASSTRYGIIRSDWRRSWILTARGVCVACAGSLLATTATATGLPSVIVSCATGPSIGSASRKSQKDAVGATGPRRATMPDQPPTVRLRSRKRSDDRFLPFVPLRKQRPTGLHPLHPPRLCGAQATQAAASLRISARRPTLAVPPPPPEAEMSCHSPLRPRPLKRRCPATLRSAPAP